MVNIIYKNIITNNYDFDAFNELVGCKCIVIRSRNKAFILKDEYNEICSILEGLGYISRSKNEKYRGGSMVMFINTERGVYRSYNNFDEFKIIFSHYYSHDINHLDEDIYVSVVEFVDFMVYNKQLDV